MLDEKRLISATAVRDAQTIAANPVKSIKMLYNAVIIVLCLLFDRPIGNDFMVK